MIQYNNLIKLLHKGSFGITDKDIDDLLSSINSKKALQFLRSKKNGELFITTYKSWLSSSQNYKILNLDKNNFHSYITLGITQSFHDFYQIQHDKTLKIMKGEYPYHKAFFMSTGRRWGWIDEGNLSSKDFVILSYPFSGNGAISGEILKILSLCNKLSIPVLLDCAFWALSKPISICLTEYPCIKIISFSLSKFFNVGKLRLGLMFSQYKNKASSAILAPYDYINSWSAYICCQLLNNFSIDYMSKKYSLIQKEVCKELSITPSDTILFGSGKGKKWEHFLRDKKFNRICLSEAISEMHKIKAFL